jgi:hypothetical protein
MAHCKACEDLRREWLKAIDKRIALEALLNTNASEPAQAGQAQYQASDRYFLQHKECGECSRDPSANQQHAGTAAHGIVPLLMTRSLAPFLCDAVSRIRR